MMAPQIQVSVLSTRYGGCHPKRLIVVSSYKIKQSIIIITITRISTNRVFIRPVPMLFLTKEEKKNLIYFIPTSSSHQTSIKSIMSGSLAEFHHKF